MGYKSLRIEYVLFPKLPASTKPQHKINSISQPPVNYEARPVNKNSLDVLQKTEVTPEEPQG
jgi:hypothetical protein